MRKIGILSDTHLSDPESAEDLSRRLINGPFADVDTILHAGDNVMPGLEEFFLPLEWVSVRGNMDHTLTDLPVSRIYRVENYRIGLVHGWGQSFGLEQRVLEHFSADHIDVLVFGHSHQPACRYQEGVLLINPGSPTDRRRAPYHSVARLEIGTDISAQIVRLD